MKAISVADPRNNFAEISAFLLNGEKLVPPIAGRILPFVFDTRKLNTRS